TRAAIAVPARLEEVDAAEAVHLHVDEAGRRDAAAVRAVQPDGGDAAVVDVDVAANQPSAHECRLDAEPHPISASLTLPPAAARRARAASASTFASSETIATLASPPASSSARATSAGVAPVASSTMRWTRRRSLSL